MIRYLTRLEGARDQVVLFTLVELMTHLIFLALILGVALRKEADPVYRKLVEKCGADGSRCVVRPEPVKGADAGAGDGENKILFASCRGEGRPFADLRALGDGRIAITPLPGADPAIAAHPVMRPLMQARTVTTAELLEIGAPIRAAANAGEFGTACNVTVRLCRAHGNASLWDNQRTRAWYYFQVVGQNVCR